MARKRFNGEGSVYKRANGTWRGQLMDGYDSNGKPIRVNFCGRTKSDVLAQIRSYQAKREEHIVHAKELTLSQWAEQWYESYKSQVQHSTYAGYRYTLKLIQEGLGNMKVQELLPMDINKFLDSLAERDYSMSMIRKCRAMLIQVFDSAEDNNLISRNPARRSKLMRDKRDLLPEQRSTKEAFSDEEVAFLERYLEEDLLGNSIRLMLCTGLRTQELLALSPTDFSEDASYVSVQKAIKTVDGHPTLGPPKSKSSRRKIPIPECCRKYARYLCEHGGKDFIWSLPGKNPLYSVGSFRRRYYTALSKIPGVRKLSPHCCRHTYVTRLEARNVPMEVIARLAGHSEIKTTDRYLHTSTETLSNAVSVLNKE